LFNGIKNISKIILQKCENVIYNVWFFWFYWFSLKIIVRTHKILKVIIYLLKIFIIVRYLYFLCYKYCNIWLTHFFAIIWTVNCNHEMLAYPWNDWEYGCVNENKICMRVAREDQERKRRVTGLGSCARSQKTCDRD
jgi:hypothetical protein